MALVYKNQGAYEKALELYERSLEITKAVLGDDHPSVADTLNNMANVYGSQGAYEKALELYGCSLTMYRLFIEEKHPRIRRVKRNIEQTRSKLT